MGRKGCGRLCFCLAVVLLLVAPAGAGAGKVNDRVELATDAYRALVAAPDGKVPEQLLRRARCIVVIPHVVKAAFFWGGRWGKGIVSCRSSAEEWSPPAFITLAGGSFGFQFGASATDIVLFFIADKAVKLLANNTLTLGGDAGVAAGPVGRAASASTNINFNAAIYSYARSKGFFAGLSLDGAFITIDKAANKDYYGEELDGETLLIKQEIDFLPASGQRFLDLLP